jgi:hypothetical protein
MIIISNSSKVDKSYKAKTMENLTLKINRKNKMTKTRMMNIMIWCPFSSYIELLINLKLLLILKLIKIIILLKHRLNAAKKL